MLALNVKDLLDRFNRENGTKLHTDNSNLVIGDGDEAIKLLNAFCKQNFRFEPTMNVISAFLLSGARTELLKLGF